MIRPSGPCPAKIMIVGEIPGDQEILRGMPFEGTAGEELSRMLADAGILRSICFISIVCRAKLPNGNDDAFPQAKKDRTEAHQEFNGVWVHKEVIAGMSLLQREIEMCRPNVIIALGKTALFALTGETAIGDWRGSVMQLSLPTSLDYKPKVVPTYSPSSVLQVWTRRPIVLQDFRRALRESHTPDYNRPKYEFVLRPTFAQAIGTIRSMISQLRSNPEQTLTLACDIETRMGHIACIGFAWSKTQAICIPLLCVERLDGYWTLEEEVALIKAMRELFQQPNLRCVGQNFSYDAQYIFRYWLVVPEGIRDTMIAQHVCFAGMEKSLDYLSSMYCAHHLYWKDDGKEWRKDMDEDKLWAYNCQDAVVTFEVWEVLQKVVTAYKLDKVNDFQQELFYPVLRMMLRGVRNDVANRANFAAELSREMASRQKWINHVAGELLNIKSSPQMTRFFYTIMAQKPNYSRKGRTKSLTCDDEALMKIAAREPLLRPMVNKISELRSIGVFLSTFINSNMDVDGRIRCSYNIAGTDTYRFASSKNAFGSGLNLQNIPSGGETESELVLPNVRKLFLPDPGMEFFDIDLSSADLRIVVWEADEREMKRMLAEGYDPYTVIAQEFYHDPTINKKDPRRQTFKSFAHGCLTAGHEVLTPDGWIAIEKYDETKPLMAWNKDTWGAFFEVPVHMTRDLGVHFVAFEGQSYSCEVTHDHRIPYTTDTNMRVCAASEVPNSARLPMCGYLDGPQEISKCEARLLAAFQADGSLAPAGHVTFHFHRERKKERLRNLLDNWGMPYSEGKDHFYIPRSSAGFSLWGKEAGPYLLQWSAEALDAYLNELQYWDGSATGTIMCHVSTTSKRHAEWIQTVAKLRGYGSQIRLQRAAEGNRQDLWRVSLNRRQYFNLASGHKSEVYEKAPTAIYCPTTSTGFFFVRRGDKVFVTGNTHYLGTAKGLAERLGLTVHEAEKTQKWYFQRFPRIKKWQDDLKDQVFKRKYVQNIFGYRFPILDRIDQSTLNAAAAWTPQSTVACLINRALVAIDKYEPEVQILLQVHDSLAGSYPIAKAEECKQAIISRASIPLPYDDPLIIPVGIKSSPLSWGDCA